MLNPEVFLKSFDVGDDDDNAAVPMLDIPPSSPRAPSMTDKASFERECF